jgi:hypothetical protein
MTPPESFSQQPRARRSASPAERAEEFAAAQRKLKDEAAERRQQAANRDPAPQPPRRSSTGKSRGRG